MKEKEWLIMYGYAKEYYLEHHNLAIPVRYYFFDNGKKITLGTWINTQRVAYYEGKMSETRYKMLSDIEMIWSKRKVNNLTNRENWLKMFKHAALYYQEHGNLKVPKDYNVSIDDGKEVNLRSWVYSQKHYYKVGKLDDEKIMLLESLGIEWQIFDVTKDENTGITNHWLEMYNLVLDYYKTHENTLVPSNYTITKNGRIVNLGIWLRVERYRFYNGELSEYKMKLLNDIGITGNINVNSNEEKKKEWLIMYKYALEYYQEHGNILVSNNFIYNAKDGKQVELDKWIGQQLNRYRSKNLSKYKIELLEEMGIFESRKKREIEKFQKQWLEMYRCAVLYYKEHGDLFVPIRYEMTNENGKVVYLGHWLQKQRNLYRNNKLSKDKIEMLKSIGIVWDKLKSGSKIGDKRYKEWLKYYEVVLKYYQEYGYINANENFKITLEEETLEVGTWLKVQMFNYLRNNLNQEQIRLLKQIEFEKYISVNKKVLK